jgi:glutathione synthase/RimK-type ligase-like ATP-grasp enzyme
MSQTESKLAIYYEHPDWFRSLFETLDRRGTSYVTINAEGDSFDPDKSPPYAVFFNRMSASAYLRGHGNAIFYTKYLLRNLVDKGVRVINGPTAFELEISKALQLSLFNRLGIPHPKTRVVNSAKQAIGAARELEFPIVVKPNIGGRGAGIVRFNSLNELEAAAEAGQIDLGIDSTALVQEFIPKRGGAIQRIETLGGKFLYGIRIFTPDENFNLCPAEVCLTENQPSDLEICLTDAPKKGLRIERFDPPQEIIETVERIAAKGNLDLGGVEYLIDDRTGEIYFYDINALSNFVADAVNIIGFDPNEKLIDFLEKEVELCGTVTGSRFSVAG